MRVLTPRRHSYGSLRLRVSSEAVLRKKSGAWRALINDAEMKAQLIIFGDWEKYNRDNRRTRGELSIFQPSKDPRRKYMNMYWRLEERREKLFH